MAAFILKWLRGFLIIRISGASMERFINICSRNQIVMWRVVHGKDYIEAYISKKDFKQVQSYVKKTDVKLDIRDKIGLPFFFYKYKKRKCFAIGFIICIAIVYTFTLFIWDISISGETAYTSEQIIKDIKENYVGIGTFKKDIDCAELEKKLREKYDKVAWISCEIKGTQLNIDFTETIEAEKVRQENAPCNIVAAKDGIITDIITRSGTTVAECGGEVKRGDILITGVINIYNDFDELVETNYVPASGDVYAIAEYNYSDEFDMKYYKKEYTGNNKKYIKIYIGGKLYTPYKPKIKYPNYDTVTNDTKLRLGNSFYLPVSFQKTTVKEYKAVSDEYTAEEAGRKARKKLNLYLDNLRKKGVEILENNVTIEVVDGKCISAGTIVTKELIGVPAELIIIEQEQGEEP